MRTWRQKYRLIFNAFKYTIGEISNKACRGNVKIRRCGERRMCPGGHVVCDPGFLRNYAVAVTLRRSRLQLQALMIYTMCLNNINNIILINVSLDKF